MASLTRREFLDLVARQSLSASIAATGVLLACRSTADRRSALGLGADATTTLIALIDEIIPAENDMPAASQVGTLAYWELLADTEAQVVTVVQTATSSVDEASDQQFGRPFARIRPTDRRAIVSALSEANTRLFGQLRDYVYEGYYLDPQVWQRLEYEPFPTGSGGPKMAPFDASLLTRVRGMSKRYREA
jgi:hypothetical protein